MNPTAILTGRASPTWVETLEIEGGDIYLAYTRKEVMAQILFTTKRVLYSASRDRLVDVLNDYRVPV